jgi:hypothetical protein
MRPHLFAPTLALALTLATHLAGSAAPLEPFTADTWRQLQREVRQPTWVVFSASDCAHCPGLISRLRQQHPDVPLWRVETDAGEASEPHEAKPGERHFSFGSGNALLLRHGIQPDWRGMTPYLALLRPARAPLFALAQASAEQLRALESARKARPKPGNQ